MNAALEATERGLTNLLLEKGKIANTIENFPEKKWVYAEPDTAPAKGKLWLDGARKEDLIVRWHQIVEENSLEVRTEEGVDAITKNTSGIFEVTTAKGKYRARRVILAIGQRGNPRKLGVAGEDQERVYHRLYSPQHYVDENILIVGGGNSAVEAALVLGEKNRVTLSYRKKEFSRLFKDNARLLQESMDVGRIQPIFNSEVLGFHDQNYELERRDAPAKATVEKRPFDHAFVLIGAELPVGFLRSVGVRLENEWQGSLWTAALVTIATLFGLSLAGPDTSIGAWSSSINALAGCSDRRECLWNSGFNGKAPQPLRVARDLVSRLVYHLRSETWKRLRVLAIHGLGIQLSVLCEPAVVVLVHGRLYPADDRIRNSSHEAVGIRPEG